MVETDHYTYRVTWSEEDSEYVGLCAEFPSLSWLDPNPAKALGGIRRLVADVVKDMVENDEPFPEPLASKRFSGKFTVRMSPWLHRRLATEATEAGISLNRLVNAKLSE